ncbi:MAG: ABC transporter ATP-binding protein/permease, partial [Mesorhizobium sp.]
GDPRAGKTLFFRALAGLWPWGGGRIGMPDGEKPFFVPRTPYFPLGSLRDVLNHAEGVKIDDAEIKAVLGEVGLERLSSQLDRS